jgi:enoyl-CoA hydratase
VNFQNILYGVEDRVATITFNRPKQHNAFNEGMIADIVGAIEEADRDPEVRVIVVTGAGAAAFSAGYDMKESAAKEDHSLAASRERVHADLRFVLAPWDCSKPVIAMIDGYCFAGALEFAMFCDVRYCSDAAIFGSLEARFASAVTTIMPWLIGQRSRVLVYTGDRFDSAEAHRLGLVDKVFPKATLQAEVMKTAKRMSRVSVEFLKLNKHAINLTFEAMGFRNSLQHGAELAAVMLAQGSPEGNQFNAIRKKDGLAAALRWRDEQFAPFE